MDKQNERAEQAAQLDNDMRTMFANCDAIIEQSAHAMRALNERQDGSINSIMIMNPDGSVEKICIQHE